MPGARRGGGGAAPRLLSLVLRGTIIMASLMAGVFAIVSPALALYWVTGSPRLTAELQWVLPLGLCIEGAVVGLVVGAVVRGCAEARKPRGHAAVSAQARRDEELGEAEKAARPPPSPGSSPSGSRGHAAQERVPCLDLGLLPRGGAGQDAPGPPAGAETQRQLRDAARSLEEKEWQLEELGAQLLNTSNQVQLLESRSRLLSSRQADNQGAIEELRARLAAESRQSSTLRSELAASQAELASLDQLCSELKLAAAQREAQCRTEAQKERAQVSELRLQLQVARDGLVTPRKATTQTPQSAPPPAVPPPRAADAGSLTFTLDSLQQDSPVGDTATALARAPASPRRPETIFTLDALQKKAEQERARGDCCPSPSASPFGTPVRGQQQTLQSPRGYASHKRGAEARMRAAFPDVPPVPLAAPAERDFGASPSTREGTRSLLAESWALDDSAAQEDLPGVVGNPLSPWDLASCMHGAAASPQWHAAAAARAPARGSAG